MEFSHNDTDVFQCFLDHANADVKRERQRNLLIMDNASWHKTKSLKFGALSPRICRPIRGTSTPSNGSG